MEPLGTITVYFPFIDEDTRNILENTMKKSYNYYDFVNTLTKMVLETESSDLDELAQNSYLAGAHFFFLLV